MNQYTAIVKATTRTEMTVRIRELDNGETEIIDVLDVREIEEIEEYEIKTIL